VVAATLFAAMLSAPVRTSPAPGDAAAPAAWVNDLSPIAASDWSEQRAAHLIERAGFGATPDEIRRLASLSPQRAVDELVDYESIPNTLKPFDESRIWDQGMDP